LAVVILRYMIQTGPVGAWIYNESGRRQKAGGRHVPLVMHLLARVYSVTVFGARPRNVDADT